ncbi:AraC family transcriptional regulator [Kordia algicida OT-1]|uniref:Transcriptional regulator n=1 Tax=Kordia algicida OT-1 TaxID=391587 RepID=A9E8H7_9FLAO|nr:AraC family transcriptional regulator [Kordia algicida]EDP94775.1 transcriptional regulator [Kordia algicida OT-1]
MGKKKNKKLIVGDVEASDIVKDMAAALSVDFEENHNEYCLRIPKNIGSGYIKATVFDAGIGVLETDYLLKKELHFELKKGIVHPLKIIFNRQSPFTHQFAEDKDIHTIGRLESVMTSSIPTNNHIFKIPAEVPICTFSIEINRKLFEEKISSFLEDMNEDLISLFRDSNGINKFYYKDQYSLDIAKFIEEFTECELDGFMKSIFLEGKAYEILINYIQQYLDDTYTPEKRKILRQATVERIEEAVEIIKNEIASVENVTVLAKRVGVNPNTLQNGFKYLYKSSVNEFIKNHRIEKAKELLETSDLNISEITYKIGINSRSYFSKIFKQRYGISPNAYLKKSREDKSA